MRQEDTCFPSHRRGAVAAADFGETRVGFPPRSSKQGLIILDGKKENYVAMMPDCVQ